MKKLYFLTILMLTAQHSMSQNLLPNGNFEIYIDCPLWYNDIDSAWAWSNPMTNEPGISGTPDYFHACANYPVSMPSNFKGYQQAHSQWAYAGIYLKEGNGIYANHREYLQTYFNAPLIAGNCYKFQMYVNLSNHCRYTTGDIGVKISNTFLSGITNQDPLLYLPSISNPSTNTFDSLRWTLVSGEFTATGGELYLLIGNFKTDLQTTLTLYNTASPAEYIYCYIDDVSLKPCVTTVGSSEQSENQSIRFYPNPASDYVYLESKSPIEDAAVHIYDVAGKEVRNKNFNKGTSANTFFIDTATLCKGIYLLSIITDTQHLVSRFVKD